MKEMTLPARFCAVLALFTAAGTASARTLVVGTGDAEFRTISSAAEAARSGATVLVRPVEDGKLYVQIGNEPTMIIVR